MTEATIARAALDRAAPELTPARCASLAVAAIAGSTLAGWWLEHPGLRRGFVGVVAMNPATAVAFLLASLALWLLSGSPGRQARRAAQVSAAAVVIVAALCLVRWFGPLDIAPDRLLFADQLGATGGGSPNRMAPNTALNFLLLGAAFLTLDRRVRYRWLPAEALALATGILGLVAVAGYIYGSRLLYGVGAFIPMAANTAVCFLLLSTGLLWARPRHGLMGLFSGSSVGALLARRLVLPALLIPLALGWLRLEGERLGLYDSAGGVALGATATTLILATLIWRCAVELGRLDRTRARAERSLRELNEHLEARVAERTRDLERLNHQLRREVAERSRAEAALAQQASSLREATAELRALFDGSPLAICSVTPDGTVRSWNRAAEELFGWSAEEVVGRLPPNVPPELAAEHQSLRDRVLAGSPFTHYETRRLRKDGESVDVSISTAPLHGADGATRGAVAVYLDIGARKMLESQLRQAQKMEAIGRLAGGVAHDFNNVLTVIRSSAEFLLADLGDGDGRRAEAVEIHDAADRASRLTRQLLAFSRQQVLQPRVLDLNAVLTELEPMMRRMVEENITVRMRLTEGLDSLRADRSQLEQVVLNLVVNARDAMPGGGTLLIETANVMLDDSYPRSHLSARPGPHVVLTVTDTGCGMDAAVQSHIFEPFFTTKGPGQGTGLGLSTVYGIVKQSGGYIWVYSEVGQGTSFKVYLPRYAGSDEREVRRDTGARPEAHTRGARILVVEDDNSVRASIRKLLARQGYHVLEAPSAEHALTLLGHLSQPVDLVISDMVMPKMSGLELRERLRQGHPGLPVLLMSGYSEEAITRLGRHQDLGPVIEKPFTLHSMLQTIRQALTPTPPS
jgi:PAS domain S-box-containing protein